jgi:hypothetical protein
MITVSFQNEDILVAVTIMDETMFSLAREIADDKGLNLADFKDLTIEGGRY